MFKALDEVKGDLSNNNKKFREALNKISLDAPNGKITLDENRQAIGTNFVTEVVKAPMAIWSARSSRPSRTCRSGSASPRRCSTSSFRRAAKIRLAKSRTTNCQ